VFSGSVGDYVTDDSFCSCPAGLFHGKCKHMEAIKSMPLKTFEQSAKELKQIKSSIDGLNTVYGGYFYNSDALIALYGKYESGKTLLLFQDVEYMVSQGKNVLFIDTEGGMKNMFSKWDSVFESRFGKFTGKKYLEVLKGLSNLTEYLGYRTQIVFKSKGKSGVVEEDDDASKSKDKGKMEFRIIESIPAQVDEDVEKGKIDHIVLDSLSAPLKVIPTDQQNFPARATASALILSKLLLLQDKFNVSVAVTSHASVNPANTYATSLDASMWGGVTLHHFSKRIVLINKSDKVDLKDYRRIWIVRVEDDAQFSNMVVVKIGDSGVEEVKDKIDGIVTSGEQRRMV